MVLKREETRKHGRLTAIAALVAATILFAVWALVFHHHELCVFIVENYVATLTLLPALTLVGLLAVIVNIDAYIRPDLKRIMGISRRGIQPFAPGSSGIPPDDRAGAAVCADADGDLRLCRAPVCITPSR